MLKATNIIACAICAGLSAMVAFGTIDQEILRRDAENLMYIPAGWFALMTLRNFRKE